VSSAGRHRRGTESASASAAAASSQQQQQHAVAAATAIPAASKKHRCDDSVCYYRRSQPFPGLAWPVVFEHGGGFFIVETAPRLRHHRPRADGSVVEDCRR